MSFVTQGIGPALWASSLLALLVWSAYRVGARIWGLSGGSAAEFSVHEKRIFFTAMGMALLALGVLAIGLLGMLRREVAIGLAGLLFIFSLTGQKEKAEGWPEFSKTTWMWIALALFLSWLQALAPPTGHDALVYHLAHPREFIESGKIFAIPDSRESLWPYQMEMFFTLGLLLQGTILAHLFHWAFYVLTAYAIYAFVLRFQGGKKEAEWAMLVFLFTPLAFFQSSKAYVELGIVFFTFAAIYAFLVPFSHKKNNAVLSGLLCGGALGTKYLAFGALIPLVVLWIIQSWNLKKASLLFYFMAACALTGGIWYARSWILAGNPIYPFLSGLFGGNGFKDSVDRLTGMGQDFPAFIKLPWNFTLHPDAFPLGELIGPLYLMLLPLMALSVRNTKTQRAFLFYTFSIYLLVFTQQAARFLFMLAPYAAVGAGFAFAKARSYGAALWKTTQLLFYSALVLHGAIFVCQTWNAWPVALGAENARDYLLKNERSFRGFDYLNRHADPKESIFLSAQPRRFYRQRPDKAVFYTAALKNRLERQGIAWAEYLDREHFTFIWVEEGSDPEIRKYVQTHPYEKVFEYAHSEGKAKYVYSIYRYAI